jgi:hypothetical protein
LLTAHIQPDLKDMTPLLELDLEGNDIQSTGCVE